MNKLIINADDCGKSKEVNTAIEEAIDKGLITSTTVMANMDDFEGALTLYNKWKEKISFGVHLNITEGHPLVPSQVFLDTKFCVPEGNGMVFNRLYYLYRKPNKSLTEAIKLELRAQMRKVASAIDISHIDSHRHMHLAPFLLPIVCEVATEFNIRKIRRARNRLSFTPKGIKERCINLYRDSVMKGFLMPDVFCSVDEYLSIAKDDNLIYELMCHPGHPNQKYVKEMSILDEVLIPKLNNDKMINYSEL